MTKTKWKKQVSELRQQAKPYQVNPCPTPNKIPYANLDKVNKAVMDMHIRGKYVRSYKCPCGVYHTSTKFPKTHQNAKNRNRKQSAMRKKEQRERREKQRQREQLRAHNRAQVMSA